MKVRKAVVPVAGLGTRMLPASKAIPKEMLVVVDKPLIQHVVEEIAGAGIEEIILVTRSGKESIENHFDSNYELEAELEKKNKTSILETIRSTLPNGVSITSVRQASAQGLGQAIACASSAVHNEPFAVLLPDVLVTPKNEGDTNDLKLMIDQFESTGASQILVDAVPKEIVDRYGVVDCHGAEVSVGNNAAIFSLVEKPTPEAAPSNLAVVGRYVLHPEIMPILQSTERGAGNEIQLTDGIDALIRKHPVVAHLMVGETYDCGNRQGLLEAGIYLGLKRPEYRDSLVKLIRELAAKLEP